jgi:hypothetical protein
MKRGIVLAVALVIVVVALGVTVQAVRMHRSYGEWGLSVPETPARIDALNRQYDKGDPTSANVVPNDFVASGKTAGGATVLVPQDARPQPIVIYVRDSDEQAWEYALVGGP